MNANITINQNLLITRDGELTDEFEPTKWDLAANIIKSKAQKAREDLKLELQMIAFDTVHRTNYRKIRHQIVEKQKRLQFEDKIGLCR